MMFYGVLVPTHQQQRHDQPQPRGPRARVAIENHGGIRGSTLSLFKWGAQSMRMQNDDDHLALLIASKAWQRTKTRSRRMWSDWTMTIGPGLMKARVEAMLIAGTNQAKGKGYNTAMSELLTEYHLHDMEGVARNDMLAIMDNLLAVEAWHRRQPHRENLNHPTTVWRQFKKSGDYLAVLIERGEYKPLQHKQPRPSLLEENVALRNQIDHLKARLEEVEQERDHAISSLRMMNGLGAPGEKTQSKFADQVE